MRKPARHTWSFQIYTDLVIGQRLRIGGFLKEKRKQMFSRIAKERNVPRAVVRLIYDQSVRPQLRAGVQVQDLR